MSMLWVNIAQSPTNGARLIDLAADRSRGATSYLCFGLNNSTKPPFHPAGFSLLASSQKIHLPNKMPAATMDTTRKLMLAQGLFLPALPVGLSLDSAAM